MNLSGTPTVEKIPNLENLGNVVPQGYQYYEKLIRAGEDLSLPTAYLKWYDIYPAENEITPEQDAETRIYLAAEVEKLKFEGDLGFVILHRAGSFLLLMLMTWRNTNEIWESVHFKDLNATGGYVPGTFNSEHRGTFCVWELEAVWHERHAWVRFLSSQRDEAAKLAYINDRYSRGA
jgi:hypothetical protein